MRSSTLPDRHSTAISAGGRSTLATYEERRALLFLGTGAGVICLPLAFAPEGVSASGWTAALSTVVAIEAVAAFAGWAVLSMWCPSTVHFSLFACASLAGTVAVVVDRAVRAGAEPDTLIGPEVGAGLAILALTGILVIEPRFNSGRPAEPRNVSWTRPILISFAICWPFVILAVALVGRHSRLSVRQSLMLASATRTARRISSRGHRASPRRRELLLGRQG
jgi:hypothetical protein